MLDYNEIDYIKISADKKYVDSLRNGRIYKVINTGPDHYLVKNGSHQIMIETFFCSPSSRAEYIAQNKNILTQEADYFTDD